MANKQIWVSPKEWWGWRIHKSGAKRDTIHIQTKEEAIKRATEIARNQKWETKIQKRDWKISGWNSYWRDPFPPRNKNDSQIKSK